MKKILTLFCALLGFGAMASATDPTVDEDGVFDLSVAGNDGNASYYSSDEGAQTCTFTFPYWVTTNERNDATHYASLISAEYVDVNKANAADAGLTEISYSYEATDGDVYYKEASAWDCAGWGWWSTAYDVTNAGYNTITAVVNTDQQVKIVAQGSNWENAASDVKNVATAGTAEDVTLVVDLTTSKDVMSTGLVQLYFQNSVVGQIITVKSITFSREDTNEPEGSTNKTWRFDDTETFAGLQDYVDKSEALIDDNLSGGNYDGLTITIGSSASCKYQSNSGAVMIGTQDETNYPMVVTFANRLQMGQGSAETKACIGVPVEGACTVYVVAASSSSDTERVIEVAEGKDVKTTLPAIVSGSQATTNCLLSYAYDGESNAEIIYFYSTSGSINFFCVAVSYDGSAPEFEDAVVVKPASKEIEGYLTVTVGDTDVTTNEAVKITVTEGEGSEMTVAIDELEISNSITLSDVAVVFTPEANGEYTIGTVSGTVTVAGSVTTSLSDDTATGTYVVDEDTGDVTFTAEFSYSSLDITVSFTTVAPVVSDGWEVIAEEFDATAVTADSNNTITISFSDLVDANYICIATTIDPDNNWGNYGALLTSTTTPDGGENMYDNKAEFEGVTNDGKNFANDDTEITVYAVIAVDDIVEACGDGANEFYLVFWSNALTVTVYASADYEGETGTFYPTTESSTEEVTPEAGWTLTEHTTVGWEQISWTELEGYDAIKFVITYTDPAGNGYNDTWAGWGVGGIYDYVQASINGGAAAYSFTVIDEVNGDTYIITVDDLKTLIGTDNLDDYFVYNVWSPVATIEVYFGVGEYTTTAIANVKSDAEVVEVARYNLMGQKISGAERGINIIVYSDGSAKKVLVK